MSHVSTIKNPVLVNADILEKALSELCQDLKTGPVVSLETDFGMTVTGQFAGHMPTMTGKPQSFAFAWVNGAYEIQTDLWGWREQVVGDFLAHLNQRYAFHAAVMTLEAEGYTLVSQADENGDLVLTMMEF